ncbi:MAG: hypothetical protein JJU12_07155 [Chlamydiales bacterium]|nr:hypothetical protein [Chlamydiales bacterium]
MLSYKVESAEQAVSAIQSGQRIFIQGAKALISIAHPEDREHLYTNNLKNWFLAAPDIPDFDPACIAQLTEVGLLRRRFAESNSGRRLCQIPNSSGCLCIEKEWRELKR